MRLTKVCLGVFLVGGCASRPTFDERALLRDVTFVAHAELVGNDSVRVRAVGINRGPDTQRIAHGPSCTMSARATLAGSEKTDRARIWDYHAMHVQKARSANMDFVCLAALIEYGLQPGDSVAFHVDFSVHDVLGDSLPPGIYRFTGILGVGGLENNVLPAGELSLRAGRSNR